MGLATNVSHASICERCICPMRSCCCVTGTHKQMQRHQYAFARASLSAMSSTRWQCPNHMVTCGRVSVRVHCLYLLCTLCHGSGVVRCSRVSHRTTKRVVLSEQHVHRQLWNLAGTKPCGKSRHAKQHRSYVNTTKVDATTPS